MPPGNPKGNGGIIRGSCESSFSFICDYIRVVFQYGELGTRVKIRIFAIPKNYNYDKQKVKKNVFSIYKLPDRAISAVAPSADWTALHHYWLLISLAPQGLGFGV